MKGRLFWKILIGFWFTFLVITQGIWLMFTLLRPEPSDYARSIASITVAAASSAIHEGGESEVLAQRATWPRDQRRQIAIVPAGTPLDSRPILASATAHAPNGRDYRIVYHEQPPRGGRGLFDIPGEVVAVAAAGGLVFSAILAWYLTQPLRWMREGFGRLAQGDFTTRLGPRIGRRRDELADLAHDFDQMAVRLEELVAARDRLLADVSHELRTPLARLNLAIGLARQDPAKLATSMDRITGEAAKLDKMVGELLTLAKLESGRGRGNDYFDFAEIVKAVVQDARYEAVSKSVAVELDVQPEGEAVEWLCLGSSKLMSRAVENIVRNALRYSPEKATIRAMLRRDTDLFRLTVIDEGPGIPEQALSTLFTPFSVSADGSGFGLGLAIAQRAIAVNGGTISAHNRTPHGVEITVTIPAAQLEAH
jgi:two-component system OmpR family sensor kinase